MEGNFNIEGIEYQYFAKAPNRPDFEALPPLLGKNLVKIQRIVSSKWNDGSLDKEILEGLNSSLERFTAFCFQSRRMCQHESELNKMTPPPGYLTALSAEEACIDFESLLFHGRAVLDRITFFLASNLYKQECDKFNKLPNVLKNFSSKDSRAHKFLMTVNEITPNVEGILLSDSSGRNLRSTLIHRRSLKDLTTVSFSINRLPDGRILRFDHEVGGYPLIGTSWSLTKWISYLVLNIASEILDPELTVTVSDCEPSWIVRCIPFFANIDPLNQGPRISVLHLKSDGFGITTKHLKSEILRRAKSA